MLFINAATVIAWLAVVMGALKLGLSVFIAIAIDDVDQRMAATRRYLGSGYTGEHVDQAIYMIVFGVCLGVLAKIAKERA